MIEEGQLGKIYHIRAVYLQDWLIDHLHQLPGDSKKKEQDLVLLGTSAAISLI